MIEQCICVRKDYFQICKTVTLQLLPYHYSDYISVPVQVAALSVDDAQNPNVDTVRLSEARATSKKFGREMNPLSF